MKALVWEGPRQMAMREQARPAANDGEVLIRVTYAGICGSELSGYLGHNTLRVPPLVMGHEFSGEIADLPPAVRERYPHLETGMPVTVNPLFSTGEDEYVQQGLNQLSPTRKLIGAHRPGAYAEYVSVPVETVFPLPDGMSLRTAALTEPVAVGVRIAALAGDIAGQAVLVVGGGPIGLLSLQALQARGAGPIFVSELDPARLEMVEELGGVPLNPQTVDVVAAVREATGGLGAPATVDAVGTAATRTQCVAAAKPTGTVILSGLHQEVSEMPAADIIRREIVVRGSFAYSPADFAEGLAMLARNEIRLDPWIVEAPLAEGGDWFGRLVESPPPVAKVLLIP